MTRLAAFGETMLRFSPPEGTRLEAATELEFRTAGAESNVAIAASNLGTDAVWLSKLPDSPLGRRVVRDLRANGVATEIAWDDGGRQGAYYIEQGPSPRGTKVVYDRADAAVTTARPDELALDAVREADVFFTSGITPALSETLGETTDELLDVASEAGTRVAFDLNYRSKLWSPEEARKAYESMLGKVDTLVLAARDAADVLGYAASDEAVAVELASTYDVDTVVVTRGEEGALARADGETHVQPAFETETLDPIGTGDAFVGGFLARRLDGDDVPAALEYGAATAALKRTVAGDLAVTTPAEVERVIRDEGRDISR